MTNDTEEEQRKYHIRKERKHALKRCNTQKEQQTTSPEQHAINLTAKKQNPRFKKSYH